SHSKSLAGPLSTAPAETSTTIAASDASTTAAGETTSTAAAATATTANRATTKTTSKKASSSATTAAPKAQVPSRVVGGISNAILNVTTAPSAIQPEPGGTATVLVPSEPEDLDPVKILGVGSVDGLAAAAVFDMLVYVEPST